MEWQNDTVLEFLDHYEKEPTIWNTSLGKNRDEVYGAWKRIEEKMGNRYNMDALKRKRDSLMASFRQCLIKIKHRQRREGPVWQPHWFAYKKMASFLQNNPQKSFINLENVQSEEICNNSETEDENTASDNSETEEIEQNIQNDPLLLPLNNKPMSRIPVLKKKKIIDLKELKEKLNYAYAILQEVVNKPAEEKNMSTLYGELVAARLQSMDEYIRDLCMLRIDNILLEMKINSYPNNSHTPDYPQSSHVPDYPQNSHLPDYPQSSHVPDYPQNSHLPDYTQSSHLPDDPQDSQLSHPLSSIFNDHSYSVLVQSPLPHRTMLQPNELKVSPTFEDTDQIYSQNEEYDSKF